jgi:hypothetical protein
MEVKDCLKFYETGDMAGARQIKESTFNILPSWLDSRKRESDIFMINLESGAKKNEPSECNLFMLADEEDEEPLGALRLNLPLSSMEKGPESYIQLVRELIEKIDFESGHAGYGLHWDPRGEMSLEALEKMFYVSKRYKGIDLSDMDVTLVSMRRTKPNGIKCINWLTLLGNDLSSRIGPVDSIQNQTGDCCTIHELKTGIIIQAGKKPEPGDMDRNESLDSYHRVGRLLAPYRFIDHRLIFGDPSGRIKDATNEWLGRFDK